MTTKPIFHPMLSATLKWDSRTKRFDLKPLQLPALLSPKLDGIRCIVHPTLGPVTRKLEPILNLHVRNQLMLLFEEDNNWIADGELIAGDPLDPHTWNKAQSAIMSKGGFPYFTFFMFDAVTDWRSSYAERYAGLTLIKKRLKHLKWLRVLEHKLIKTRAEVRAYEEWCVKIGYEGAMARSLDGPYKEGRATPTEGYLWKLKRVKDHEAKIIGFEEAVHNANKAETSKLGYTKRSSHKANRIPKGTLGAFIVTATFNIPGSIVSTPVRFDIGTLKGFTAAMRQDIWNNRDKYLGKWIRFKYQKLSPKGIPIFPVGLGFRED